MEPQPKRTAGQWLHASNCTRAASATFRPYLKRASRIWSRPADLFTPYAWHSHVSPASTSLSFICSCSWMPTTVTCTKLLRSEHRPTCFLLLAPSLCCQSLQPLQLLELLHFTERLHIQYYCSVISAKLLYIVNTKWPYFHIFPKYHSLYGFPEEIWTVN